MFIKWAAIVHTTITQNTNRKQNRPEPQDWQKMNIVFATEHILEKSFGGTEMENKEELLEWEEGCCEIICPYCKHAFSDEIYYMPQAPNFHWPRFCPDCGHEIKEEVK